MHTYTHTYMHAYTHTYIHTYTHTHTHTHTCVYMYIHAYMHTHTHAYIPTYIYIHTHTCIIHDAYTHTHAYMHMHTHTYTHPYMPNYGGPYPAQVNADIRYYTVNDDGTNTLTGVNTSHVGKNISTKAIGSNHRQDVTLEYKFKEGSTSERAALLSK